MFDIQEIRQKNINEIIKTAGSAAKLSEITGISASALSQMKSGKHKRNIGDKSARMIEGYMKLDRGWMDRLHRCYPSLRHKKSQHY